MDEGESGQRPCRLEEDVRDVSENTRNLSDFIEKSKTEVTVLFTDIVNSTQFWDQHGDTAGRLMLDLHNTLLFPVVKAFRGTIVKVESNCECNTRIGAILRAEG